MAWINCASCKRYYNNASGGCTNAACDMADRSTISRALSRPASPRATLPASSAPDLTTEDRETVEVVAPTLVRPGTPPPRLSGPAPVALTVSSAAAEVAAINAARQLTVGADSTCMVYRGDSRTASEIRGAGGFHAWTPLTADQARLLILKTRVQTTVIDFFPPSARRFNTMFQGSVDLGALMAQIKLEKARDTFHISTEPTEACGGYASGHIYGIRLNDLYLLDRNGANQRALTAGLHSGIFPSVVFNGDTFATATVIGVARQGGGGMEVAFLTSLPMAMITCCKAPGATAFTPIP